MRTEPEDPPFPSGFAAFALAVTMWAFGLQPNTNLDRTTVRAETFAPARTPKEGLIPPHLLEDAIEARLRARRATFLKDGRRSHEH